MTFNFKRFLVRFLIGTAILLLLLVLFIAYEIRNSFPQMRGQIRIAGLKQPVRIYRDVHGVPQIYASTQHDLFMAQGFVHAQDRFWQMDVWRHIGGGRLSEIFGKSEIKTDHFLRTLGWSQISEEELKMLDWNSVSILQDYASGVNAYLSSHGGSSLSFEYAVVKLLNSRYSPELWHPVHTLTWAKVMSFDLSMNMDYEINRARLLKTLSPSQVDELYPPYSSDNPVILPRENPSARGTDPGFPLLIKEGGRGWLEKPPSLISGAEPFVEDAADNLLALRQLMGANGEAAYASNNWVISGKLTSTGKPLLANDPHLGEQMPSIWYQIGLHCTPRTDACPFDVTGFSFAGVPGVITMTGSLGASRMSDRM
jgi:penicillin amidase